MTATPTTERAAAMADLAEHGYCLIEGALPAERVRVTRDLLVEIAAREIADGTDYVYEDGSNQRVWTLLNKGPAFADIAADTQVLPLVRHLLGHDVLLSNLDANIAGPGGKPMFLHADQSYVPAPWPYALVANAMWMLDDFTPENGATRVVPGSHRLGYGPDGREVEAVPVCGPAGTVMVFDGRLWHQTGANTTEDVRRHGILAYYCRAFLRTQENWWRSLDPAVAASASPELRSLLGYEMFLSLGMVDGMPRSGMRF